MRLSAFVGTNLDGFIANQNGDYDFLPAEDSSMYVFNWAVAEGMSNDALASWLDVGQ